ncbi:hypothetical protein OT109_10865 [Phycisphaeraceae bacterium D3-23]
MFTAGALLAGLSAGTSSHATDWTGLGGPGNQLYHSAANWNTGVPAGLFDTAVFQLPGTSGVLWDNTTGDTLTDALLIDGSNVTMNTVAGQANRTHFVINDAVLRDDATLMLGFSTGGFFQLNIAGSLDIVDESDVTVFSKGQLFTQDLRIGSYLPAGAAGGDASTLTVDGAGAIFSAMGDVTLGGNGQTGELTFRNGAIANRIFGGLILGSTHVDDSRGVLTVSGGSYLLTDTIFSGTGTALGDRNLISVFGTGSILEQSDGADLTIGSGTVGGNTGLLEVFAGGVVRTGLGGVVTLDGPQSNIVVGQGGTLFAQGQIQLNGAGLAVLSGGVLNFSDAPSADRRFFASNGSVVVINGGLTTGSVSYTIDSGSSLTVDPFFQIGEGQFGDADLIIDGVGSSLQTGSAVRIGADGDGSMTVSNQATADIDGSLVVGDLFGFGQEGRVSIESGGVVTSGSVSIAAGDSNDRGRLTITGSGSLLQQNGSAFVTIGNPISGGPTVTVTDGGRLETGTGIMRFRPTGTLRVDDGGVIDTHHIEMDVDGASNGGTLTVGAGGTLNTGRFTNHGGTLATAAGSTVRLNRMTGMGNAIDFNGNFHLGVDLDDGVASHTVSAGQTFNVDQSMVVGAQGGITSAEFIVDGGLLTVDSFLDVASFTGSDATFRVLNGGNVTNGQLSDYGGAATATLEVDGAGSQWNVGSVRHNRGTLTVANGGSYHVSNTYTLNANGVVNINNGGTFDANGDVDIVGGTLNRTNVGNFDLAANRMLTASSNATVMFAGNYELNDGTTIEVEGGSSFTLSDYLDIGDGSDGTLIVQGAGSSLVTNTGTALELYWGAAGGTADVTIRNGASATIGGLGLELGRDGNASSDGTLRLQTGATMTTNAIEVAVGTAGSGTISVGGAGSALTQNGASQFIVGGSGSGAATVNLTGGGAITTGTGVMRVGANGVVNLNGGTLVASTIEHVSGGQFNFIQGNLRLDTFNGTLVNDSGTLAPGGTPGDTDTIGTAVIDNYTQLSGGTLALEVGSATNHDALFVTNALVAGGTLEVSLAFGASLNLGDRIDLLDWDLISGTFRDLVLEDLGSGFGWNAQDLHTDGVLSVELEGDLNTDGFVGVEDLDIVLANWNATVLPYHYAAGDVSGDSFVDGADLAIIQANWGAGNLPGNVPEPGTAAVLGLMLIGIARRLRVV